MFSTWKAVASSGRDAMTMPRAGFQNLVVAADLQRYG